MKPKAFIPVEEFKERVAKAAALVREWGLDALIVNGSEADYANTRYFSNFWPLFERCGVAIAANGDCALMVGPESEVFAQDKGVIDKVFVLYEYRESADPSYPELSFSTFQDVFKAIGATNPEKIGVAAWLDTNVVMMEGIKNAFPKAEIVRADKIMTTLRSVKSENEIACIREASRISNIAAMEVIKAIRPGITELQLVGVAQRAVYENGAEYEGLPMYCFAENSTKHAISRCGYRELQMGDIVEVNPSAKVCGYSPSIGMPVSLGKLTPDRREMVEFGLEVHNWTFDRIKAGVIAGDIAKGFKKIYDDRGYGKNFLYGPCHGLGLIEVEAPWMETTSDYALKEGMTFQIDTFVTTDNYGLRWEKSIAVRKDGAEDLSPGIGKIYEVEL